MFSLADGFPSELLKAAFQICVDPDAQNQWTEFSYGKDKAFIKEVMRSGHACSPLLAQLGMYGQITLEVISIEPHFKSPMQALAKLQRHFFLAEIE